jgi:hypothetical protein
MAYIGKIPATGNFVKLDAISVVNGQAGYTMQSSSANFTPESANHMLVSLNGVIQAPITSFTVSGSTITFASGLSTGDVIDFIMVYGNVLDIGTPSDNTVSTAKLVDTSVTAGKLATDSVIEAKIQNDAVTRDKINAISTSSLPSFEAKGDGTSDGYLQLNCSQNSHGIKLKSPPHSASASYTLTFPNNDGNANELLKTDGSGVLSWGAVSSDFVLLATTDITSSTALVEFDGLFSSTYKNYKIIISGLLPVNQSVRLNAQMKEGGSYITSGAYTYCIGADIVYNTTTTSATNTEAATNGTAITMTSEMKNSTSEVNNLEITIYDPLGSHYKAMTWHNQNYGNALTNLFRNYVGGSVMRNGTGDCTAIKFYMDSGNIVKGNFKLYGMK